MIGTNIKYNFARHPTLAPGEPSPKVTRRRFATRLNGGDPKIRNDGTEEWRNDGTAEWRNDGTAKWRNDGTAEWRNGGMAEWRNGGK